MDHRPDSEAAGRGESERLVRDFLAGDRRAFDRLVILHQDLVFGLCLRFLGEYDEADDCAQEVFIKVIRSLGSFRFESSFETWLYRVTVNTCKNRLSSLEYRMRSRRARPAPGGDGEPAPLLDTLPDGRPSPCAEVAGREIYGIVRDAIDSLPHRQRLVIVLRDMEAKSYEEISELTGLRLGTVKSQISRARKRLREILKGKI